MKRQKKLYSRPRRPFDKARIEEENVLKEKYGLKNKKEIWKADAAIGRIRNLAKELITASEDDKQAFIDRLKKKGFPVENIAEVLALNKEDWLKRRLQTILHSGGHANTSKQARQLISHKHVAIGNQVVNVPSYQVALEEEPIVKLNIVLKTEKPKSKEEKIKEEILGENISPESSEGIITESPVGEAVGEVKEQKAPTEELVKEETPKENTEKNENKGEKK
jgi:small subunit ribosomal protein S4